jgi:hypothetical protein
MTALWALCTYKINTKRSGRFLWWKLQQACDVYFWVCRRLRSIVRNDAVVL